MDWRQRFVTPLSCRFAEREHYAAGAWLPAAGSSSSTTRRTRAPRSVKSCTTKAIATETAADGFKALGKLEEFAPDVILTDLKMPGLDGIAFMEKARAAAPGAVFVVMTAFGTISSAVEAVKKGADNYLTKPLDYEALGAVVERAMEKARLVQETRQLRDRLRERNAFQSHRHATIRRCTRSSSSSRRSGRAARACSSPARAARARSSSPRRSTPRRRARRSRSCV